MSQRLLAQSVSVSGVTLQGPLVGIRTLGDLINKVTPVIMALASIILFLIMIWGGIDFILSRGNPEKVKSARMKITYAIVGFIIMISAYMIIRLVVQIFGLGQELFR